MKTAICLLSFLIAGFLQGQEKKSVEALKISVPIVIDGIPDDPAYSLAKPAKDFVQLQPYNGKASMQPSEVYIFYDQTAVYVGAILYDSAPDSIFDFLSERDEIGSSDYFGIYFDPYNQGQVAYGFFITPAGVQTDLKAIKSDYDWEDGSWNAIWQSKTRVTENGWVAEMRIPYSALRFPENGGGKWGLNMCRNIRRYNSNNTWNRIDTKVSGFIHQEGELTGITNIKPPVGLSLSPFTAIYTQLAPGNNAPELKFKGGLDLKYGLNESFTLDMMLIPDFGQIQSDDKTLNLTPYELYYSEKRQFFTEGIELFNRGNIFYSKRIGAAPKFSSKSSRNMKEDEIVTFRPSETQLLNATKISGRTGNGWGFGFLNSITLPSYSTIRDTLTDSERKVLIQPLTNFNVSVVEKTLKNNSYISLINTNIVMANDPFFSNVTATDFQIRNKAKSIAVSGKAGLSVRNEAEKEAGFFSSLGIEKNSGKLQYGIYQRLYSDRYNPNDLGYLQRNNEFASRVYVRYLVKEPFWIFRETRQFLELNHNRMFKNLSFSGNELFFNSESTFRNNYSLFMDFSLFGNRFDFYEPRVAGRYYVDPSNITYDVGISSDQRKAVSGLIVYRSVRAGQIERNSNGFFLATSIRLGKKFQLHTSSSLNSEINNRGFAGFQGSSDSIIFAQRDIRTVENAIGATYTFNHVSGVSLRIRHYLSSAVNKKFYNLNFDGKLSDISNYDGCNDQNFNLLNLDLLFRWVFAPGSELTVAWKKSVLDQRTGVVKKYAENLRNAFTADQYDSFSLKILYYIDYNNIRRR
jgi:hypothetical protein